MEALRLQRSTTTLSQAGHGALGIALAQTWAPDAELDGRRNVTSQVVASDSALQTAAVICTVVLSVQREIDEDLAELEGAPTPTDDTAAKAIQISRELAQRYARQPCVDIAGFVASGARVGVLAHSMDTGRRITFYIDVKGIRAIRTGAAEEPTWLDVSGIAGVRSLLNWITHVD